MTIEQADSPSISNRKLGRRPVEAMQRREDCSAECEKRVREALTRLPKTGAPFTIKDVCDLAKVGKTFIYDKSRPELTKAVLDARAAAKGRNDVRADLIDDDRAASWRGRARAADAQAEQLKSELRERDRQIHDLIGQLSDPSGDHLVDEVARLRDLLAASSNVLQQMQLVNQELRRSLDADRSDSICELERDLTALSGRSGGSVRVHP